MSPLLGCDDTIAFLPKVDCALLVAASGDTRTDDLKEARRILGKSNILGTVLNKAPAAFMPNRKVDRKALLAPEHAPATAVASGAGLAAGAAEATPRNELERGIADVWSQVLGMPEVPIHTNFFDLGGHSLLLAQVRIRLAESLALRVSIIDLFQYPTVSALAQHLGARGQGGEGATAAQDERRAVRGRNLAVGRRNLGRRRRARE
jgi:acyl carrier protein